MARLTSAKCPHCGAAVRLDLKQDWVTCAYCGTSSFIARQEASQPTPAHYPVIRVDARAASGAGLAVALVAVGVVLIGVVGVVVFLVVAGAAVGGDAVESLQEGGRTPKPEAASDAGAQLVKSYSVDDARRPLLGDVNGDGTQDAIVLTHVQLTAEHTWRYAAFSGKDGELIWVSRALTEYGNQRLGLTQGWLLQTDRTGQLNGLRLKDGLQAWTTALGDEATQLCESDEANTVLVFLKDERKLLVDVRTGAQKPAAAAANCRPIPENEHGGPDRRMRMRRLPPRTIDANDQRDEWACGSVRVMGSSGNYVSPDPCPRQHRLDAAVLEKLDVATIRRFGEADWILLGVRRPGSRVPTIGLAQGGKLVWSLEVPEGNPMVAEEGTPEMVELAGQNLVVGYALKSGQGWHVTAIATASGKRQWDVATTTGHERIAHLVAGPGRIYVAANDRITALDPATGKPLFAFGEDARQQPYPKVPD